jgi:hypothetical protein
LISDQEAESDAKVIGSALIANQGVVAMTILEWCLPLHPLNSAKFGGKLTALASLHIAHMQMPRLLAR